MAQNYSMGDYNYVTFLGWMRNVYDLSGTSLVIYAIIYGFSQTENQWCSASQRYLEEWSGASLKTVKRTLNDLVERGIIKKRYFTNETGRWCEYKAVIPDGVREGSNLPKGQFVQTKGQNGLTPKGQNVRPEGQNDPTLRVNLSDYTIKDNYNNNNNIYIGDKSPVTPAPESKKKFVKPTVEEIATYCRERNNNVDAQYFFDYYEGNGWKRGKTPLKDWKATVRTWERNAYSNSGGGRITCGNNNPAGFDEMFD